MGACEDGFADGEFERDKELFDAELPEGCPDAIGGEICTAECDGVGGPEDEGDSGSVTHNLGRTDQLYPSEAIQH